MSFINPGPGTANEVVLTLVDPAVAEVLPGDDLDVPALQDITINNANYIFTWSQFDATAKFQIATTSTNGLSGNIVVDEDTYFGNAAQTAGTAGAQGILGLSTQKVLLDFTINFGTKTISGQGYVVGLSPSVSADSPVWVSPFEIAVSGEYTVA